MKRTVERKYVLNAEDVKTAILYWLRDGRDFPCPDDNDQANLVVQGYNMPIVDLRVELKFSEEINDD